VGPSPTEKLQQRSVFRVPSGSIVNHVPGASFFTPFNMVRGGGTAAWKLKK
jgi:hypothetical protein